MYRHLRSRVLPAIALAALTLTAGCDSASGLDDLALGSMTASIDGSGWEAVNATANRISAGGATQVTVAGTTLQAQGVSFSITDTGPGTYPIDDTLTPSRDALSASYTQGVGNTFIATSGTIEVTRFDEEGLEGTFRFEARNQAGATVTVTDGRFNVGFGVAIGR